MEQRKQVVIEKNGLPYKSFHTCSNQLLTCCYQIVKYHPQLDYSDPSPDKCQRSKCSKRSIIYQNNFCHNSFFESIGYFSGPRNSYVQFLWKHHSQCLKIHPKGQIQQCICQKSRGVFHFDIDITELFNGCVLRVFELTFHTAMAPRIQDLHSLQKQECTDK